MRLPGTGSKPGTRVLAALLVVVGLLAAWQTSHEARNGWWPGQPHQAVGPGGDGVARAGGLGVELEQVAALDSVPTWEEDVTALPGHRFWHVQLRVDATNSEVNNCEVGIEDSQGRIYLAGANVPPGVEGYAPYPDCSPTENGEPTVQEFIVTTPADSEPHYVRLESSLDLNPRFLRLPVG